MGILTVKRIPLRFWASLTGIVGIAVCSVLAWVNVTFSKTVHGINPEDGVIYNMFDLLKITESSAIRTFITVLIAVLFLALGLILLSLIFLVRNKFENSRLQVAFTYAGFGIAALVPLVFIIFSASVNDPSLMRFNPVPIVQIVIALVALVFSVDKVFRAFRRDWQLYVLLLPAVIMVFIFVYLPMYGIQIAFRDFKAAFGIAGSKWVGLKNFSDFFASYYSVRLITNTFLLNIYGLLWGFPIPIIMAIFLNQLNTKRFKNFTQTVIYAPHFISPVVMVGMILLFLSPTGGFVNKLIELAGGTPISFMLEPSWFRTIFISTDVWQHAGWNTILYIATLTAIDPGLYEAATMDGASKLQKIRYIDIPHLLPIVVMILILNCGALLTSNTDKALLMQTDANIPTSDIIGLYVYRMGIKSAQYSYTAAINLLVNVINFVMIISVNWVSKRLKQTSLF